MCINALFFFAQGDDWFYWLGVWLVVALAPLVYGLVAVRSQKQGLIKIWQYTSGTRLALGIVTALPYLFLAIGVAAQQEEKNQYFVILSLLWSIYLFVSGIYIFRISVVYYRSLLDPRETGYSAGGEDVA